MDRPQQNRPEGAGKDNKGRGKPEGRENRDGIGNKHGRRNRTDPAKDRQQHLFERGTVADEEPQTDSQG